MYNTEVLIEQIFSLNNNNYYNLDDIQDVLEETSIVYLCFDKCER